MPKKKKPFLFTPYTLIATWFGAGLLKPGPGTWGSAAALPFGYLLVTFAGLTGFITGVVLSILIGYWASARYEEETKTHDAKEIVVDEVAGQWITLTPLLFIPDPPLWSYSAAFILFRFFDITKIWPIYLIDQKVDGALGVMGDDVLAGIFAAIVLWGGMHYAGFGG